jgi:hypothetical protein
MQQVPSLARRVLPALTTDAVPSPEEPPVPESLHAFSQGQLSQSDAIHHLGLRDYAELLVALGDVDLTMPMPSAQEIEAQAAKFTELWRQK